MDTERFNQLLNGPLHHPFPMFAMQRVVMALHAVVEATGEAGSQALERFCGQVAAEDAEIRDSDQFADS